MKVLIYGSSGWIGSMFLKLLHENNIETFESQVRVDNVITLTEEIIKVNPTHICSFIGRTHGKINNKYYSTIDYLEQKGKLTDNIRDNLYSPIVLAKISKELNIHFTYLGTGCIFTYADEYPDGFVEENKPNFFGSSYSIVKGFTDQMMHLYEDTVLNLRIRMPITGEQNPRNFITKITSYNKICSIPNSMTVLTELLPYIIDMMKNKLTGTVNLTNPGVISHNEILTMYRDIVDPFFTWKNFTELEQRAILDSDRSNNLLNTDKLTKLYPQINNIKDAVKNILYEYKENIKNNNNLDDNPINLLITGGCGFIGSNFINYYFQKKKINMLINFDAMYYCADENNIKQVIRYDPKYKLIKGNLNDYKLVENTINEYNINYIIHFAAQSHVQNSFEDSLQFTQDNILGTHTLLEVVRKYNKIKKFIHVSTDEVYGESMNRIEESQKTEHSVLCPTNPYAATKAGAELIAQSYSHSYKLPIIITRGNNVFGIGQYPEKLIPKFIKLLKENKKLTIQGDGSAVRAFLHAYDTATAFETILEKGKIGEIYNIGCDNGMEYSVMEIAKILIKMVNNTEDYDKYIEYIEDRPFNDQRYYISNQKLKNLGWSIKINLSDGINECINYY
jgi:nucleoside-diphosphate-sugar epimerase